MSSGSGPKIFASIFIITILLIAAYISRFFIDTVILGVLLAYMLSPVYGTILGRVRSQRTASLLAVSTIFLAAILIILVFYRSVSLGFYGLSEIAVQSANQSAGRAADLSDAYYSDAYFWQNLSFSPVSAGIPGAMEVRPAIPEEIIPFAASFVIPAVVQRAVDAWIFPALQFSILNFALILPVLIAQTIVAAFLAYYLLLTGKGAAEGFPDVFPGQQRTVVRHFLKELNGILKRLFTTNFDIAAYNALVGMTIFSLIGMPLAIIWALLAAFASLIRFIGPWIVFVPLSLYFFLTNDLSRGFLVLLFGIALLEYVPENLLRPYLARDSSKVNVVIEFLSYVAPILVLGAAGIIIGPLIYGTALAIYRTASHFNKNELQEEE
ncbi:MAG: AI-2E family transporter [Methanotrichaceae archaeon]|nr:AI-2E family transporter [Methanotrichaceae archaeon]